MNINFQSGNIWANNINKINKTNITGQKGINSPSKDIFVRNTNNVSFGSAKETKYSEIKKDMTEYFMNAEELSVEEIGKKIKEHLPDTEFDDIKNVPKQSNANKNSGAYTSMPMEFRRDIDGNISITSFPKTIYLNFHTPTTDKKEERIILLDRLLHEMTHVLREEDPDEIKKEDLFNNYIEVQTDERKALSGIQSANMIFNSTEKTILNSLVSCMRTMGSLPKEVNKRTDIDTVFMKKTKMSSSTHIKNVLSNALNATNMQNDKIDKNFALDFVILKAKDEKEAYKNALNSDKELSGINSKTDFDLRIELYEKLIETAEKMKS